MKYLITTIAAVVLVGCGTSVEDEKELVELSDKLYELSQSPPAPELKPIERIAGAKVPDISIHDAVFKGNMKAVKQHLAAGTDVNAKANPSGFKGLAGTTPLHDAASNGYKEIAELLIANGGDVNAELANGLTPLDNAAQYGHKKIVELLIANGANVIDETLHAAAYGGHKQIAELLIAKGVNVNAKEEHGATPLDLAIQFKNTETADLLRKHGAKTGEELDAAGN